MDFKTESILYGGDYFPEQWLNQPDILAKDIALMKKAGCNTVTMGMFAWSTLEPDEGRFELDWLEDRINTLHDNGIHVILATPSGARPKWLSDRYPEVLRVDETRHRQLFGGRHNHCFSSPVYREKVRIINERLAQRFAKHPAVILWHLSNEYCGECHCEHCQQAFRDWLQRRYGSIDALNDAWCTTFWSHTYHSFAQVESPSSRGEHQMEGLLLDWKRFVTDQTIDFIKAEIAAVRPYHPSLPVTTNLMYSFDALNYFKLKDVVDIISWDTYPQWHKQAEIVTALDNGLQHDLMRSIKGTPFLMMESVTSATNWQGVSKLKKPNMNRLSTLQAIAHGSDAALFFQWRQSRGSVEKFHGAFVDHYGEQDTRVFDEATLLGAALQTLREVIGATVHAPVAVVYDWENDWAIGGSHGPRNNGMKYKDAVKKSYTALRKLGLDVDIIDMECDISKYRFVAAPMLYMLRNDFDTALRSYVSQGGLLALGYFSGIVDESDRCFQGGMPHNLMDVTGLRMTEIDGLFDHEHNKLCPVNGNSLRMHKHYRCDTLCALVKTSTATTLMTYGKDFYAGTPAFTQNNYGNGSAYYICADAEQDFYDDAYAAILGQADIHADLNIKLPEGVEMNTRHKEGVRYVFLQNFNTTPVQIDVPDGYETLLGSGGELGSFGTLVLKQS